MTSTPLLETKFRRLAVACFVAAGGLNGLVLLAWRLGVPPVGVLNVAGSAVLLLLGLAVVAWLGQRQTDSAAVKWFGFVIGLGVLVTTGLIYAKRFDFGPARSVEDWLILAAAGDVSAIRMSKLATFGCLLLSLAWFGQLRPWFRHWAARQVAAILALTVLVFGATILLCYLLQANFYTLTAILTAVEFFLLGLGLMLTAGFDVWPLRLFFPPPQETPSTRRFVWGMLSLVLLLAVTVGTTNWYYFKSQKVLTARAAQAVLANLADLKAAQIADWRRERRGDARYIVNNPFAVRSALELLTQPISPQSEQLLRDWVKPLIFNKSYDHVFVLDESLNLCLAQPKLHTSRPSEPELNAAKEAISSQKIVEVDLHRVKRRNAIFLSYALPLNASFEATGFLNPLTGTNAPAERQVRCAMILRIDARASLIPMAQTWATTSATTELELVRQEGDEVVVLNELRHRTNAPLTLRVRLAKCSVEAKAVLGLGKANGETQGGDYRDVPVLAVWRKVPGTPWLMIAKLDQDEVYAPLHRQAWTIAGFVGLLIAAAMLGIALLGRQRYLNSIRREVFLDRQHREDETKFRTLFESSRDAIMLRDRTTLIDCNRAALELFGFATKEQFMAKRPGELSPPRQPDGTDSQVTARDQIEAAYAQGGQFFRWLFQRQDETVFPAEVQLSRVELDKKVLLQALVRDIGSRKRVEEALRRSEGFLDSIIEHSPHAMWISDDQGTLIRLNQACRDLLHLTDDEVVGKYNMLRDNLVEEQGHMPLVRRVFEKGETVKFAVTYDSSRLRHLQLRDTAFAVLDVTVSPVLDANGRVVYGIIQHVDITERKQMEQALREREARYAALFEHNPIETIVVDLDGRIQAFNRAKRESGDRLPQIGEVMYRDYAGKHTTDMHGELMHCIQSGELRRYPEQLYGERSLTIAIAPFANGAIITSQDITEHKRAEEALKESESRLRIIIESSKDGIILFDGKTRKVMFGNAAMAELLGCSREDLVGRSVPFRHPTEERESIEQEFQKHVRGEISFSAGIPVFRDDGSVFEADISSRLLMLEGRSYISAFFRDITERKRAEDSLRNSEEHLRMICENAPVMMDAFDKEGRCTMWNKECEKTFGWTIEEINSHDEPLSLFYPDPKIRERVMETITSKPERIFREWHPQTKDGRVLTCMWANFVLPDKSVMNLGYDVTERRQTEQSLRKLSLHASRAEDAERRRIARELHDSTGQKLAALSMTVGLLQDTTAAPDGKTDKMFADCLALIEQCVQEIRTISYLLHPPLLDELGLAAAIGDYLEGFSKRSGLQVALDAPPGLDRLPDEVELALFRVVQESLGNIHHHAGASTARIRLACDAEQVTLEVSDQGRGMSAETLRAIQAGHGPAGVGIAGMRERLRLLGGQLEITSGQRGTTLRAIIPRPQKTT